jgi:hypothetical protein
MWIIAIKKQKICQEILMGFLLNYYGAAKRALFAFPVNLAETSTIFKKKGWAFNELSCCRLGRGNLSSAEIAFADM